MTFIRKVFVAAALFASAAVAKADIVIDDFGQPNPAITYSIGPDANPLTINTDLGSGLSRSVVLSVTSPTTPGINALSGQVGGGFLTASFDVFSSGTISVTYTYAAPTNFIPTGVMGALEFLGNGDSGFAADIPLTLSVATATGTLGFDGSLPLTTTPSLVDVPLSSLTGTGDLTMVNSVTLNISAGRAADLIFDTLMVTTPAPPVNAIPAPPALFLALAAVPAIGLRRRFAKKA